MTITFPENKLVLASHNHGKLVDLKALLSPYGIEILTATEFNLDEPIEDGDSFQENALIKASYVHQKTGLAVLADDSGLCVNALNGEPGIYSADWAGKPRDFRLAMKKVNDALGEKTDRSAYFISVLALQLPNQDPIFFEGKCEGHLIWPPRGEKGFGYSPMFVPEKETLTFAEMNDDDRRSYSHRGRALKALIAHCF